jgi:hypothetical protein
MFSKDIKHYRPTPRTIQDVFGPYHQSRIIEIGYRRKFDRAFTVLGTLAAGIILGLLCAWRG